MKRFIWLLPVLVLACTQKQSTNETPQEGAKIDTHTNADPDKAVVKHLDLDIKVDFATQVITGKASWTIENRGQTDKIIFDTRQLQIQKVTVGDDEKEAEFSFSTEDRILGRALSVKIQPTTTRVNIYYATAKDASALQWLNPQQTAGKKQPFLFTQSQPILARSWIPCQDGPGIRFTYNAIVTVPKDLLAVMSAENPQQKNKEGVYSFKQTHPIPSYLLALAVGDLQFKAIDERTGVYAEPSVLVKAAWEFADMGKMVVEAEKLYGPYRWGRYDVLVLPPSFPYGGMENPNLTFATPTVIAGDRSLVSLIAHELAHSWSGNLVTNASWNDMWLNEGFTTYFERRIVEAVYGKEEAKMQEVLGRQSLEEVVAEKGSTNNDTKLKGDYKGRDPDEGSSDIVYEKGYAFLRTVEEAVGRAKLDSFLKTYFNKYAFQSKTTEQFLQDLEQGLIKGDKALEKKIKVQEWVYQPGIPANIPPTGSADFQAIDTVLTSWRNTTPVGLNKNINSSNELLYFLSHLPADLTTVEMAQLDKEFKFTQAGNAEVQCAWYTLALRHQYKPAYANIKKFLTEVGRRKFLLPLYKELIKTPEGKTWAKQIYAKARANYHPVSYLTIDELLK
ncbi:MAG TPA: M1 family metallopeptidase [Segetibacter sp.]|jgi:leukotriene A-4 hydrolase/aminopeptidase